MGYLDDLKKQADALKSLHTTDVQALQRNAALADSACKSSFQYLSTLAQQLNVLRPVSKVVYRLDRRHALEGLHLTDFRADARRKRLREQDSFDHVVLRWRMASGKPMQLTKDFVPDIEQLEARLKQGRVRFDSEAIRHPETAKLQQMRYAFVADLEGSLSITPDHDAGRLQVEASNLDGFEAVSVSFPAFALGTQRLDEFARWLLGEPNGFLTDGQQLRRVEA